MSSLTASAISGLSGLSYGSSSVTDHVDLGIIDDIIERAPRSATTFPLVQRAYSEVLLENGISPVEDTTYFQFLLKLGIIRAATWGERWDLWRANNDPSHTPIHEPSSATYQSFSADVKSRLPFLASASSDLDEGFAPDVDVDDERSDISRHTDLSVVHMLRPSPRKSMTREKSRSSKKSASRSTVGYTPSQSLDYDILTLNPPLRTSTPVYAQEAVISPPLPPYSVSEISEALDDASSIDFDRTDRDRSATPRADTREVVRDRRERTEKELAEMELLADSFYHTGLLGRCLDVWAQANQWVQQTTRQIDLVRARILQRQTLLHWRKMAVLAARERSLSEQRLAASQEHCWKCWRARLERRRVSRWEDDMKRREDEIASAQTERRLRQTFQHWRNKARDITNDRKAVAFHSQTILRQTVSAWYRQTTLSQNLGNFNDWRAHELSKQSFEVWRYRTRLRSAERALSTLDRKGTLRQVFDEWQTRARQIRQAVDTHNRHLLHEKFDLWRMRVQRQRHLERTADQLHKLQALRAAFTGWKYAEQGRRIQSAVDKVNLAQKFGRWRGSLEVLRDMRRIADDHHGEITMRLARWALLRWRERFRQKQTLALRADLLSDQRVLRASLGMWRRQKEKVNANRLKAISFNVFFTQRQALSVWRSRLEEKQRDARLRQQATYVKKRRLEELRAAFEAWRDLSTYTPRDNAAVFVVQSFRNQNLMRTTLNVWTERVIFHKSRELDVIDKRTATLLRNAFTRWRDASARIEDTKSLMQSFVEVRDGEALRSIFSAWKSAASARRQRREALDRSLQAKDDRFLVSAFTKWRGRFREQQLAEIEQEVARRHEDALMFRVWDRWQGRSLQLKSLRFENARLKKFVWDAWRAELEWARRERDVSQPRDRRILEEAFEIWREAYSSRVAKASRTRRFRPSLTAAAAVSDQRDIPARGQLAVHHPFKPALDFSVSSAARRKRSNSYKSARLSLPSPDERPPTAPSVISEPASARASADSRRWRSGSAEPDVDSPAHEPQSTSRRPRLSQPSTAAGTPSGSSELLRALRGTLNR